MSRIATPPRLASLSGDGGGEEGGGPLTWLDGLPPVNLQCQVGCFISGLVCSGKFSPPTNVLLSQPSSFE